jgi:2',3'-cyclic-nucleotide 2'-phosphodiesterase (5'-nucleotidase family)
VSERGFGLWPRYSPSVLIHESSCTAGIVTLGDILEILPFDDSIVVLEMSGSAIWDALESSLRTWPAHEGYVVHRRYYWSRQ